MAPQSTVSEHSTGRRFLGRIPFGEDIVTFLERFCGLRSIRAATICLCGQVSTYTFGAFDQEQKVFVTQTEHAAAEIVSGSGNILLKSGKPFVCLSAVLSTPRGEVFGGRLFPATVSFSVEFSLLEITGDVPFRTYDEETGLFALTTGQPAPFQNP